MGKVSKETYERLIDNRPFKLAPEEADYGPAKGEDQCQYCIHFFVRKVDGFTVCEIVRPDEDNVEAIIPNYKCMFFTHDGEEYPFLEE